MVRRSGHPEAVHGFVVFTAHPILKRPPYDEGSERPTSSTGESDQEVDWQQILPTLHGLFAGFLFEAWPLFYASASEAVLDGIAHRTDKALRAAIVELDQLMSMGLSERDLGDALFYGLGSHHDVADSTHAEWLTEVARHLREALDEAVRRCNPCRSALHGATANREEPG